MPGISHGIITSNGDHDGSIVGGSGSGSLIWKLENASLLTATECSVFLPVMLLSYDMVACLC